MSDGMGRELAYLSSHATNRYFIPNWGILYNYAMNILCIKTGDGYDFYSMLKQAEIDVQSTSNRKLPNFYPSSG